MKSRLLFQQGKYLEIIRCGCNYFTELESNSINDVSIEDCISDFSKCVLICHSYLIVEDLIDDH